MNKKIYPFLKWAGGKRWLVNSHKHLFTSCSGLHIEPFAGSAAIFFALQPKRTILSDMNHRLIETYKVIRDDLPHFEEYFQKFSDQHSREFYYATRKSQYLSPAERAAQFVYLNRVCFNGLYRENLRGEFNVPIGSKDTVKLSTDDFRAVSRILKRAELLTSDFEEVVDRADQGDFLYVDPPYTTRHNLNGFVKYNQNIFSWHDQKRLAHAVRCAHNRGVSVVVSNADHEEVRRLYEQDFSILSVERVNVIASRSKYRGQITEMVATNIC